jgi:hypothetical protein
MRRRRVEDPTTRVKPVPYAKGLVETLGPSHALKVAEDNAKSLNPFWVEVKGFITNKYPKAKEMLK